MKLLVCVSTIFNEGAYLTFKSIFHKALNLLTLESVSGTNQYQAIMVMFLAQGNNGGLGLDSNPRPLHYESDVQTTATHRPLNVSPMLPKSMSLPLM